MNVLKPENTPQELSVLVRPHVVGSFYTIILRDKEQRSETSQDVVGVLSNGRLTFTITNDFRDEAYYYMRVLVGSDVEDYAPEDYSASDYFTEPGIPDEIYRGTIYITNQTDFEKFRAVTSYEQPQQEENAFIVIKD